MTIIKADELYTPERPESRETASESFLPAGSVINVNYPVTLPWTPKWADAIKRKEWVVFLHVEV